MMTDQTIIEKAGKMFGFPLGEITHLGELREELDRLAESEDMGVADQAIKFKRKHLS